MSNMMVVPSSRGGFKSLPAELKVGGHNPWSRMRAQAPGYGRRIRLQGLGDCTDLSDPSCYTGGAVDWSTVSDINPTPATPSSVDLTNLSNQLNTLTLPPPGYSGPLTLPPTATTPTPPTGYNWAQVLNATGQTLGQVLAISQGGSTTTLPNGARIIQGTPQGAIAQSGAQVLGTPLTGVSISTIALFGGIGLLVIMMMQRGK